MSKLRVLKRRIFEEEFQGTLGVQQSRIPKKNDTKKYQRSMYNKIWCLLLITMLSIFYSCNSDRKASRSTGSNTNAINKESCQPEHGDVEITKENEKVFIVNNSNKLLNITFSYLNKSSTFRDNNTLIIVDLDSLIRKQTREDINNFALYLIENNKKIPISVSVNDLLFECFYFYHPLRYEVVDYAKLISGKAAILKPMGEVDVERVELKKWLYHNKKYLNEKGIDEFYDIVYNLSQDESNVFKLPENVIIPIVKDFKGEQYRVETNVESDYYYLFAAESEVELEAFVAEIIANNFPYAESDINKPLSCFRTEKTLEKETIIEKSFEPQIGNKSLKTICLICINENWTKKVFPLGMVFIDNEGPLIFDAFPDNERPLISDADFSRRIAPVKKDRIFNFGTYGFEINYSGPSSKIETLFVRTGKFRGNNANFIFQKSGGIKTIMIEYGSVLRKFDVSSEPRHFTINCYLPLNLGENYVKIKAVDEVGNIGFGIHKINMVRDEDNTLDVNINVM